MLYHHNYLPWIAPLALQNERVTDDRYIIASDITAGREVDSNRTAGDNRWVSINSKNEDNGFGRVGAPAGFFRFNFLTCSPLLCREVESKSARHLPPIQLEQFMEPTFVIAEGTTYEIEHKGTVSLQPGFKVEKGATFSVKPSDY